MLLGNKEKTIRLHAENFLLGDITFTYGGAEDERHQLAIASKNLATELIQWLGEDKKEIKSEEHTKKTNLLYANILGWRIRGRITGKLQDIDLESRIEDLIREKAKLEDKIKTQNNDILKAVNQLKDQDRQMALMESQIFFMKQGKSGGV